MEHFKNRIIISKINQLNQIIRKVYSDNKKYYHFKYIFYWPNIILTNCEMRIVASSNIMKYLNIECEKWTLINQINTIELICDSKRITNNIKALNLRALMLREDTPITDKVYDA